MKPMTQFYRLAVSKSRKRSFALAAISLLIIGCGRDKATQLFNEVNQSNIQRVANLYCVFQAQNNFKGPQNEEELKAFIAEMHPSRYKFYGINPDKIDGLFISERDKKPFKIRWELQATSRQGPVPIVFESEGLRGKFLVAFSSFELREVEQFDYEELWAGKRDGDVPDGERPDGQLNKRN